MVTRINVTAEEFLAYAEQHPDKHFDFIDGEKFMPEVCINQATEADYLTTPPLLAVEIRFDSQSLASQQREAQAYLRHGAGMVILAFPREQVEVYRPGQDVLPGFRLPVRDVV